MFPNLWLSPLEAVFCSWADPLRSFFLQDLICVPAVEGFFSAMWKHLSSLASSCSFFFFFFSFMLVILSLLLDKKSDTFWTPSEEVKGWQSPMNTAVLLERNSNSISSIIIVFMPRVCVCVHTRAQPCPTLCNFMGCNPSGSSVHGVF